MTAPPPIRVVSAYHLRRLFNERRLAEAARSGELTTQLRKDSHPSPPQAPEPVCTRSQAVVYLDADGNQIALVHQYMRRDGTLGASGLPDPKWLLHEGEVLIPEE